MVANTAPKPPRRSITPRSDSPISTNTSASSRNTMICQNAVERTRTVALKTSC